MGRGAQRRGYPITLETMPAAVVPKYCKGFGSLQSRSLSGSGFAMHSGPRSLVISLVLDLQCILVPVALSSLWFWICNAFWSP
ncbi:hypothetical protein FKM82_025420 [Ascaphus truei]